VLLREKYVKYRRQGCDMAKGTEGTKTGSEFCEMTGLSRQRLSRFVKVGALPRNADGTFPHPAALHSLIEHLSETAAGRGGGSAQADLAKERAALARAQREAVELKNSAARGDLVSAELVGRRWGDMCSLIRSRILGIPSNLPSLIPHLTRAELAIIDDELRGALTELADKLDEGDDHDSK
jgi:phage terminase Nu1 subunit (DNA packaging protein)